MNACLEEAVVTSHGRPHAQLQTKAAWNAGGEAPAVGRVEPAVSDLQTGVQSWVVFLQMAQAGCGTHAHVPVWVLEGDRADPPGSLYLQPQVRNTWCPGGMEDTWGPRKPQLSGWRCCHVPESLQE